MLSGDVKDVTRIVREIDPFVGNRIAACGLRLLDLRQAAKVVVCIGILKIIDEPATNIDWSGESRAIAHGVVALRQLHFRPAVIDIDERDAAEQNRRGLARPTSVHERTASSGAFENPFDDAVAASVYQARWVSATLPQMWFSECSQKSLQIKVRREFPALARPMSMFRHWQSVPQHCGSESPRMKTIVAPVFLAKTSIDE